MQASTMCGSARSELRVSCAARASENVSAAVLLDPAMPAVDSSSLAICARNATASYTASAVPAIRIATPQVTRMMRVSFCPMETRRRVCISAPVALSAVVNNVREREQARADLQPGAVGGVRVDQESDVVVLDGKLDRAARLRKSVGFSHHQHVGAFPPLEDFLHARFFRRADEYHLAMADVRNLFAAFHRYAAVCNHLALQQIVHGAAEWVQAEDADGETGFGPGKTRGGPVDKFGEIEKESRFQLVFSGCARLRRGDRGADRESACEQGHKGSTETRNSARSCGAPRVRQPSAAWTGPLARSLKSLSQNFHVNLANALRFISVVLALFVASENSS